MMILAWHTTPVKQLTDFVDELEAPTLLLIDGLDPKLGGLMCHEA
jgi:hypothetical protein